MSMGILPSFNIPVTPQPVINKDLLIDKASGKYKKKAPNPYMLFPLQIVKQFKGLGYKPEAINIIIGRLWNHLGTGGKDVYVCASRNMQKYLDRVNAGPYLSIDSNGNILGSAPCELLCENKQATTQPLVQIPVIYDPKHVSPTDIVPHFVQDPNCYDFIYPINF